METRSQEDRSGTTFSTPDPIKYEFDTLIEEYQIATTHTIRWLEADERGFEFSLVALGGAVVATSFIIDQKVYVLLLILTLPFYILTWAQSRRALVSERMVSYVTKVIAPRLNAIIQNTATQKERWGIPVQFISWEAYVAELGKGSALTRVVTELPHLGRIILQLGAAVFLVLAYIVSRQRDAQYLVSPFDDGLVVMNIVLLVVSVIAVLIPVSVNARRILQSKK